MPGRFSGEVPKLENRKWEVPIQRSLHEFLRRLKDGMTNLQLTPGSPTTVNGTSASDPGVGPAPALDDHAHALDVTGTPVSVGITNAQGTQSGVALVNHSHRLGIVTTKGDLLSFDGTDPVRFPVGSNGQVLSADSSATSGLNWQFWVWQDLRAPATSLRLGAGGADPNTGALIFRNNQDDVVFASFQMPHGFKKDAVHPHIHWQKSTSAAGTVNWEARWVIADIGGTFADITGVGWTALAEEVSDSDTARKHALKATTMDLSAYDDSVMILLALRRQSAAGGDTYAADAHLLEIDIHHQIASLGSTAEF